MEPPPRNRALSNLAIVLAALACASFLILWYSTSLGIGTANDGLEYVSSAQSIVAGRGVKAFNPDPSLDKQWVPLTVFPPLYPISLAVTAQVTRQDVIPAARYLHGFLLALNSVLAAGLAYRCTRSLFAAAALGLLAMSMLLAGHAHTLSEAMFIALTLGTLWLVGEHVATDDKRNRWIFLILSALCLAAAMLTRYAGASVLAACAIAILFLGRSKISQRVAYLVIFGLIAVVPLMLWTHHLGSFNKATGRELLFHPPDLEKLNVGLQTFGTWFIASLPGPWRAVAGALTILVALGLFVWSLSAKNLRDQIWNDRVLLVLLFFTLVYLPFVLVSMSFFDALTQLNARILSPMLIPLLVVIVSGFMRGIPSSMGIARCIAIACLITFTIFRLVGAVKLAQRSHDRGLDYTTRDWRNSAVRRQAFQLPRDAVIFTNAWDVLYLTGNRRSYSLPGVVKRKADQAVPREKIAAQMKDMQKRLGSNGYIVYFDSIDRTSFLATPEMIEEYMPLEAVAIFHDNPPGPGAGRIYRLAPAASK